MIQYACRIYSQSTPCLDSTLPSLHIIHWHPHVADSRVLDGAVQHYLWLQRPCTACTCCQPEVLEPRIGLVWLLLVAAAQEPGRWQPYRRG
jgi:hypothetical protein